MIETVYKLSYGYYDISELLAICTTRELAEKFKQDYAKVLKKEQTRSIEEYGDENSDYYSPDRIYITEIQLNKPLWIEE